jgi:competence protein ComEC
MFMSLFFLLGIMIYNTLNYFIIGAVISALFLIVLRKKQIYIAAFSILFLILGYFSASLHTKEFDRRYAYLSEVSSFEGYVTEAYDNNYVIRNYKSGYRIIATSYEKIDAIPGEYIHFPGNIREKPEYKKRGYNSREIDAYVSIKDGKVEKESKFDIRIIPVKIKYDISSALININKTGGAFISGIVSGYIKDMEYEDKKNFEELGLSHILAISGFNLGIIYYAIALITRNLNAKLRYIVTITICFVYTLIGGFEPSIFRAFIMILIATFAKLLNRPYDILNGITLSGLIMLCFNSFYIYNLGFLLSFAGTYGIILLKSDIEDIVPQKLVLLKEEISVGFAAFIPTLPIILWSKGFFSLISIIINIIVSPLIALITIISFICTLLYVIIKIKILLYPAVFLGLIFVKIIGYLSNFSMLLYIGKPSLLFITLYFLLIALKFKYLKVQIDMYKIRVMEIAIIALMIFSLFYNNRDLKVHVLNVGQGDSILIETPHRQTILIDTGPKFDEYIAAREKVVPYIKRLGYKYIDTLIITHFHNDHAGGMDYLVKNYDVRNIVTYDAVLENNISKLIRVSKGDELKIDDVVFKILYPESNISVNDDKNETCLIMEMAYKNFTMLLTADAEQDKMETISGEYDIYKVPHHGSIKSHSVEMLNNSVIGTAIIPVGKNSFGHPSKVLLKEFEKKQIKVYRTDKNGDIIVISDGDSYHIKAASD